MRFVPVKAEHGLGSIDQLPRQAKARESTLLWWVPQSVQFAGTGLSMTRLGDAGAWQQLLVGRFDCRPIRREQMGSTGQSQYRVKEC